MGDQFEKFIIDNRNQFDDEAPSGDLWNRIEHEVAPKRAPLGVIWKIAAVLFLASTIVLLIDRSTEPVGPQLSQEFVQAEDYYVTMINQRKDLIKQQLTADQEALFLDEINQLDGMYLELKETYQANASNERVVDAMINNLQLRLDILNRQVEILENIKGQTDANETFIEI